MPISLLEAMAFGLPVITRPVGGIKDFFEDGMMGFMTPSGDSKAIEEILERILKDHALRSRVSIYNYNYAREHFAAPLVIERMRNLYSVALATA